MQNELANDQAGTSARAAILPLWTRVADVVCAVAALPLLAGVTAVVAVVAMGAAPGPIYYLHDGWSWSGRRIRVYRFRTLRVSCPGPGGDVAGAGYIPGGRFLRSSGLSELPQILNLLRGEISLFVPSVCPTGSAPAVPVAARSVSTAADGTVASAPAPAPALGFHRSSPDRW